MASLLPSVALNTWARSTTIAFSRLNTFTLSHYGLLSSCLRFTHAVTCINAKLGSDGRLTLSGWLFNQLDLPSFSWRTKALLLTAWSIGGLFYRVKGYFPSKIRGGDAVGSERWNSSRFF